MSDLAKIWTKQDGAIDGTYGYNDFLMTYQPRGADFALHNQDTITPEALAEAKAQVEAGAAPTEEKVKASGMIKRGDTIFRYGENGPLIVRHPIFMDTCTLEEEKPNNIFLMTEDEARAIAYFSDTAYDFQWCEAGVTGINYGEYRPMMTPWDLSNPEGRTGLEKSLSKIEEAKEDAGIDDPLGLAKKISDVRSGALRDSLEEKMGLLESVEVKIEKNPVTSAVEGVIAIATSLYAGGLLTGRGFHDAPKLDKIPSMLKSAVTSPAVRGAVTGARSLGAAALRFGSGLSGFLSTPLIFIDIPPCVIDLGDPTCGIDQTG